MNILVTGGAGFIGSQVCKTLSQNGYTPISIDNLSHGGKELVKWGPLVQGNFGNRTLIKTILKDYQPKAIIHLAAHTDVRASLEKPAEYYENNVEQSFILAEEAIAANVPHFIFASSCAIYGNPQKSPVSEETPFEPISPYGRTKLMFEQMLTDLCVASDMNCCILRFFNVAGCDPDCEVGETHEPPCHLIPILMEAALRDDRKFTLFGSDLPTPDGTPIRDYIHVADIASAMSKSLEYLIAHPKENLHLNLASEQGISVHEAIEAVEKITGKKINIDIGPARAGDPTALIGSSKRAQKILDWAPTHSSLSSIVETTYKWMNC